jgi:hypothetical protein
MRREREREALIKSFDLWLELAKTLIREFLRSLSQKSHKNKHVRVVNAAR